MTFMICMLLSTIVAVLITEQEYRWLAAAVAPIVFVMGWYAWWLFPILGVVFVVAFVAYAVVIAPKTPLTDAQRKREHKPNPRLQDKASPTAQLCGMLIIAAVIGLGLLICFKPAALR